MKVSMLPHVPLLVPSLHHVVQTFGRKMSMFPRILLLVPSLGHIVELLVVQMYSTVARWRQTLVKPLRLKQRSADAILLTQLLTLFRTRISWKSITGETVVLEYLIPRSWLRLQGGANKLTMLRPFATMVTLLTNMRAVELNIEDLLPNPRLPLLASTPQCGETFWMTVKSRLVHTWLLTILSHQGGRP